MSTLHKTQTVAFRVTVKYMYKDCSTDSQMYYFTTLGEANEYIEQMCEREYSPHEGTPITADIEKVTSVHFLKKNFKK